jgi:hypothetical protein
MYTMFNPMSLDGSTSGRLRDAVTISTLIHEVTRGNAARVNHRTPARQLCQASMQLHGTCSAPTCRAALKSFKSDCWVECCRSKPGLLLSSSALSWPLAGSSPILQYCVRKRKLVAQCLIIATLRPPKSCEVVRAPVALRAGCSDCFNRNAAKAAPQLHATAPAPLPLELSAATVPHPQ